MAKIEKKTFELLCEVEEFFRLRCCDCRKKCDDGASDHCKVRYLETLADGLEGAGLLDKKRTCFKCKRLIRGKFFIPEGDHEFCGIPCFTVWQKTHKSRERSAREKATSHDVSPKRRSLLAGGDGGEAGDRASYNGRRKPGGCDA